VRESRAGYGNDYQGAQPEEQRSAKHFRKLSMHLVGKVDCLFILVALAKAFKMNSMARISLSENCAGFPDIFSSLNLSPSWDVQNGEWALRRVVF